MVGRVARSARVSGCPAARRQIIWNSAVGGAAIAASAIAYATGIDSAPARAITLWAAAIRSVETAVWVDMPVAIAALEASFRRRWSIGFAS